MTRKMTFETNGGAPGWLKKTLAWGGWILALLQGIVNSWPGG